MAIVPSAGEFPRTLTFLGAALGIFNGFFSFVFACVLYDKLRYPGCVALIMLALVIIACAIVLILTAVNILRILQTNVLLAVMLVVFSAVCAFIKLVVYCVLAKTFHPAIKTMSDPFEAYFAVCIVLILLLFGLIAFCGFFAVILIKHHQTMILNVSSATTTVTSTSRTVATTIETPPASYINQPSSYVPK